MGYQRNHALTREDYSIIMLAFGFDNVDEFMRFVDYHDKHHKVFRDKVNQQAQLVTQQINDRPIMLSGGLV